MTSRDHSFNPAFVGTALEEGGFALRRLVVVARGTLTRRGGSLALIVDGLEGALALEGKTVRELGALAGGMQQRVQITGEFVTGTGGTASRLIVTAFEPMPTPGIQGGRSQARGFQ